MARSKVIVTDTWVEVATKPCLITIDQIQVGRGKLLINEIEDDDTAMKLNSSKLGHQIEQAEENKSTWVKYIGDDVQPGGIELTVDESDA